jgi:NitT/TauT family transport system permease protein
MDERTNLSWRAAAARARAFLLSDEHIPAKVAAAALLSWELVVRLRDIPEYVLPAPSVIALKLFVDRELLFSSLLVTLTITLQSLLLAIVCGVALALAVSASKTLERALMPFAVTLQVTPIIAIAPLLLVYLAPAQAVLVCAFLVAFFPILSNTALGLASTDHALLDLFDLYRAPAWKKLVYLKLPAALPQFLAGLRIAGGLALIGAVVAELAAGAAGQGTGLAFRIVEAGFRLDIARMFAALTLISLSGLAIHAGLAFASDALLSRWHDSARARGE